MNGHKNQNLFFFLFLSSEIIKTYTDLPIRLPLTGQTKRIKNKGIHSIKLVAPFILLASESRKAKIYIF